LVGILDFGRREQSPRSSDGIAGLPGDPPAVLGRVRS